MTTQQSIAGEGRREGGTRSEKALYLFEHAAFERVSKVPEIWIIETPSSSVYEMEWDRGTCGCTDYERHWHLDGFRCKHLRALAWKRDWLKQTARACAPYFPNFPKEAA